MVWANLLIVFSFTPKSILLREITWCHCLWVTPLEDTLAVP